MQLLQQKLLFKNSLIHLTTCSLAILLSACGGGSGGSSGGGDSGGQDPDPVVVDLPIAFVKRSIPVDDDGNRVADDALSPADFNPGAELILKDRASASALETSITAGLFGDEERYDVKDLEASSDGSKILFSMRAPDIEGLDDDEQPKWNIWEYDLELKSLRRIISSDIVAEAGHDIAPHYLPDGRIVFSSTRQRRSRAILLDESKPQFSALDEDRDTEAFVLHVMDEDGADITQITFNQSHDLQPAVLSDGKILFTRWDNVAGNNSLSLYTVEPDGHKLTYLYGLHSQNTGTNDSRAAFLQPREMPDGKVLVSLRSSTSNSLGGDMVAIDVENFVEINQPTQSNAGAAGPAQVSLSIAEVTTDGSLSPHGQFSSVYPLFDGTDRLLVSWSLCSILNTDTDELLPCTDTNLALPNIENGETLYGLWIYNLKDGTQRPIVQPDQDTMYTEAIALEPKTAAVYIPPKAPVPRADLNDGTNDNNEVDEDLFTEGVGAIHIRSVYSFDGQDTSADTIRAMSDPGQAAYANRPARFLRIEKPVSMPDDDVKDFDNSAFGRSSQQLMREIIGYVPIEPDGSVKFKIPADIPFSISVLDVDGRRLNGFDRHENWLQLRAGEQRECSGCHTDNSEIPHGRPNAEPVSAYSGALSTGVPFPNTNPAMFADQGETMAEVNARINGIRTPSVDINFFDNWVDPAVTDPATTAFDYAYSDLATAQPATSQCQSSWGTLCRTVIHYEQHIQPVWDLSRPVLDSMGTEIANNQCSSCHNPRDAMGQVQVPAGQLDLTNATSPNNPDFFVSYSELFFNDLEQEVVNGALVDRQEQATDSNGNPVFETDDDGNLILDNNGNPIPVFITFPVSPVMRTQGAVASNRFFNPPGTTVNHSSFLSPAEKKLIAEWLDIGAQYYNDPFTAPDN